MGIAYDKRANENKYYAYYYDKEEKKKVAIGMFSTHEEAQNAIDEKYIELGLSQPKPYTKHITGKRIKIPIKQDFIRGTTLAKEFGITGYAIAIYLRGNVERYYHEGQDKEFCYAEESARKILTEKKIEIENRRLEQDFMPSKKCISLPPLDAFKQVAREFKEKQDSFWG